MGANLVADIVQEIFKGFEKKLNPQDRINQAAARLFWRLASKKITLEHFLRRMSTLNRQAERISSGR